MPRPTARKKGAKKAPKKKAKAKKKKAAKRAPAPPPEPEVEETTETPATPTIFVPGKFDLGGDATRGRARIQTLGDEIGRVFGTHTAMPMHVAPVVNIMRMPIGILVFDFMTGGGIVLGRNNRIKGPKDTLKTTMCLRATRAAQKTCRHCLWRLVTSPDSGRVNCRCPEHRFWLRNERDYIWVPPEAAIQLTYGILPQNAVLKQVKGVGRVPVLKCAPPPHMEGKKGYTKAREIPFVETFRCEPMRCAYCETERTIDRAWAEKNGVDPSLVLLIGGKWAEQCMESVERTMLTREFDFVVIDSTSMMETKHTLEEKQIGDTKKVAGKAQLMTDFIKRIVSAQAEEGLASRYAPTLLTTSHLTTKNIGWGTHAYLGATDGRVYEHGIAMDILMHADRFVFNEEKTRATHGEFTFTIDKNHCGGMGSTKTKGQIKFWLVDTKDHPVGDSNDLETIMDYARDFGAPYIQEGKGKAKLVLSSDHIPAGRKPFSSVTKCKAFLRENDTVYDDLRHRILNKLIEDRTTLQVVDAKEPETVKA